MTNPRHHASNRLARSACALAVTALLGALLAPLHAQEQLVLKLASREVEDSPTGQQLAAYARWVHEQTRGVVRVELLLGGRAGAAQDLVRRTAEGSLQGFAGSAGELAQLAPALAVLEAAGALSERATVEARLDGPIRARVTAALEARGLVFAFWSAGGFRAWLTRQSPATTPAMLKDLRVARPAATNADVGDAPHGAKYVDLPAADRAGALAADRLDAVDAEPLHALASEAHRGARHMALCEHAYVPRLVVLSKRWHDGLPAHLKQAFVDPPEALVQDARSAAHAANEQAAALLKAAGTQVHTCSASEHRAFVEQARKSTDALARALGSEATSLLGAARD